MNIFRTYARKSLRANGTRTIVTIIGIILSAAMVTAVTTIISSVQAYGIAYETKTVGGWHVRVRSVDTEELYSLREGDCVKDTLELQNIGYAQLENGSNTYKPYLCLQAMNEAFAKNMPIHLTEGRMPENENEILIPLHLAQQNPEEKISLGDTLQLQVGYRESEEGEWLWQEDALLYSGDTDSGTFEVKEKLVAKKEKAYTVTGFYERAGFENYSAPGYTALTLSEGIMSLDTITDVFLVLKHPSEAIGIWEEISGQGKYGAECNNSLLRFYGHSVRSDFNAMLYGMGGCLIFIIVLGSVSLIYNAFAISISERTKQFGLLISIGATKKQMKKTVIYEALLLCIVGIPVGILAGICGIGITLSFFKNSMNYLIGDVEGVVLRLSVPLWTLAVAAVVGVVTVLISAGIPLHRALKVSAIDAIRLHSDIRLTRKQIRIPAWVCKCFGLEGMIAWKNFKRNKRQHRATIFSLAMSIILFVTTGAFSQYLFGGFYRETDISNYDVQAYIFVENLERAEEKIFEMDGTAESTFAESCGKL